MRGGILNRRQAQVWTLLFIGLGFLGTAAFYSYIFGVDAQAAVVCPVCPNIDSVQPPVYKFFRRVLLLGPFNALFFVTVGWTVISLFSFVQRRILAGDD